MAKYELRLIEDGIRSGQRLVLPADGLNRVIYVAHGGITLADQRQGDHKLGDDEARHVRGAATITAGEHGAAVWRWELAPAGHAFQPVAEDDGASRLKLACPLHWPLPWPIADQILMRADSVSFPSGGCAYPHTHQGPGIRCLIEGGIRIDTGGHSTSYAPGAAWFESGPAPVFAQGAADRPTRFIRVMVLPATLRGKSSISYVRAEDRDKPKSQSYKGYVDTVIDMS